MKFTELHRIETERLILRVPSENDAGDMYKYACNPNVGPNAGWKPHTDIDESRTILSRWAGEGDVMAIVYKADGRMIGSVGLHSDGKRSKTDNVLMLGYVLAEDYWGMGLMTECVKAVLDAAFTQMNLDMVSVTHFTFNMRSKRVIEKCGFKYEGTLRRAWTRFDGAVLDEACYSLMRDEWSALK